MKNWKRVLPLALLIVVFGVLIYSVYQAEQQRTITDYQTRQMLLAHQASRGIQSYFDHCLHDLTYLVLGDHIINLNDRGRLRMQDWSNACRAEIRAITRVDSQGRILFTVPFDTNAIGADISTQVHI